MNKRRWLWAWLAVGCAGGLSAQNARLRLVHVSPDAPALDILVNGTLVIENLPYREYTEYLRVPAGGYGIQLNAVATSEALLHSSPALVAGRDYTALAVGYVGGKAPRLHLKVVEDDNSPPASGAAKLRFLHAAPAEKDLDLYLTTPFETLEGKSPAVSGAPFEALSGYLTLPAGAYQARATASNTKYALADSRRLTFGNQAIRTLVAVELAARFTRLDFLVLPGPN